MAEKFFKSGNDNEDDFYDDVFANNDSLLSDDDEEDYDGVYKSQGCRTTTFYQEKPDIGMPDLSELSKSEDMMPVFEQPEVSTGANVISADEIECVTVTEQEETKEKKSIVKRVRAFIVGLKEWTIEVTTDAVEALEKTSSEKPAVRTYSKKAEMPKTSHAKAYVEGQGKGFKYLLFAVACIATGAFLGIQANSYYYFKKGEVESAMSCAFGWLMVEDLPTVISPLNAEVFFTAFAMGAGILAVIGLFIWLDSDAKKRSRVGHEHGQARLGSKRDFKIYKNKFMD